MNGKLPRLRIKTKMNKALPAKRPNILFLLIILGIFFLIRYTSVYFPIKELKYGEFYRLLKENPSQGDIVSATKIDSRLDGQLKDGSHFFELSIQAAVYFSRINNIS